MSNPSADACELLDWCSRRPAVRWSLVPLKWRALAHELVRDGAWLEAVDVRHVGITTAGRAIAAAFRHGRAATAPGQREAFG